MTDRDSPEWKAYYEDLERRKEYQRQAYLDSQARWAEYNAKYPPKKSGLFGFEWGLVAFLIVVVLIIGYWGYTFVTPPPCSKGYGPAAAQTGFCKPEEGR